MPFLRYNYVYIECMYYSQNKNLHSCSETSQLTDVKTIVTLYL